MQNGFLCFSIAFFRTLTPHDAITSICSGGQCFAVVVLFQEMVKMRINQIEYHVVPSKQMCNFFWIVGEFWERQSYFAERVAGPDAALPALQMMMMKSVFDSSEYIFCNFPNLFAVAAFFTNVEENVREVLGEETLP